MLHRALSVFGLIGDISKSMFCSCVKMCQEIMSRTSGSVSVESLKRIGSVHHSLLVRFLCLPTFCRRLVSFLRAIGPSLPRPSRLTILTSSDLSGHIIFRVVMLVSLSQCHPRRPAPVLRQGFCCGACPTSCRL